MATSQRSWRSILASAATVLLFTSQASAVAQNSCASFNTGSGNTPSLCRTTCSNQGAPFGVVQGQNCWCSNIAPGSTTGLDSCGSACPGYPYEQCGSTDNFGYIDTGAGSIAGTSGGTPPPAPATSAAPISTPQPDPSPTPPPPPPTSTAVVTSNVLSTNVVAVTSVATYTPTPTPSYTPPPEPTTTTVVSTNQVTIHETPMPPSTKLMTSTSTWTPTPVTSTQVLTASGSVVTNYVTITPTAPAAQNNLPQPSNNGLSNGAVAGITVGAIIGAAIVGLLIFFCCWRRRRENGGATGLNRNTSVLSKVGLLRSNSHGPMSGPPRVNTSGLEGFDGGPRSAGTLESGSQMSDSRRSRPMFVDNRLNPNAMFSQANASRTSIGTLQDNADYSRPLEVRNPD